MKTHEYLILKKHAWSELETTKVLRVGCGGFLLDSGAAISITLV
jgi:hypothetical protein